MRNIFFVFSPFHLAIVNKIVKDCSLDLFTIILLYEGSDKALNYACSLFGDENVESLKISRGVGAPFLIFKLSRLAKRFCDDDVVIYTASPKSLWFRFFFSKLGSCQYFNVIDDGVAVLATDGYLWQRDSFFKRLVLRIFAINDEYLESLKFISCYYKFYDVESVYDRFCSKLIKVKPVFLAEANRDCEELLERVSEGPVKLLLTGPFSEFKILDKAHEIKLYHIAIAQFSIDYLVRHPAEGKSKYNGCGFDFLETEMYAEQVIELLSREVPVEVYSFSSSVLANVNEVYNVSVYCLDSLALSASPVYKKLQFPILRLKDDF